MLQWPKSVRGKEEGRDWIPRCAVISQPRRIMTSLPFPSLLLFLPSSNIVTHFPADGETTFKIRSVVSVLHFLVLGLVNTSYVFKGVSNATLFKIHTTSCLTQLCSLFFCLPAFFPTFPAARSLARPLIASPNKINDGVTSGKEELYTRMCVSLK